MSKKYFIDVSKNGSDFDNHPYCSSCGVKRKLIPQDSYDSETGKQMAEYKCNNELCKEGCNHSYRKEPRNIFQFFFDDSYDVCSKCGRRRLNWTPMGYE